MSDCLHEGHVALRGLDRCFRCREPFVLAVDLYVTQADCARMSPREIEGLFTGIGGLFAGKMRAAESGRTTQ